jgi:Ni,Fe-hydrogenase I large subunit
MTGRSGPGQIYFNGNYAADTGQREATRAGKKFSQPPRFPIPTSPLEPDPDAMSKTIIIDPVTRIEGHLSVKVEAEGDRVTQAFVSGEMFRGFEQILKGRDPLDAQHITQRICGVCPVEHGLASVFAQEQAFGISPPNNGRLVRNLIQAANFIMSHISHFYLLSALDFVDVTTVVKYSGDDPGMCALRDWAKAQLASKSILPVAPFLPRYAAKYLEDSEANLTALRHYLEALEMRMLAQDMGAVFAGKLPHAAVLIPGGVTETVTALKIAQYRARLERLQAFIRTAYLPDVVAVAGAFPEYFSVGRGPANYLAFGAFPESADGSKKLLPGGVVIAGKLQPLNADGITEDVSSSLFSSPSGRKPTEGETVAAPDKAGAYSWVKAPRYEGQVMEVGALARTLVAYQSSTDGQAKSEVDALLKALGRTPKDLESVMGRHAARALECRWVAERCNAWLDDLKPEEPAFTPCTVPDTGQGRGLTEAARGALGHWLELSGAKIRNYQCVVPTTWNCSPRDDRGTPGAVEQALVGLKLTDPENPMEVARVVRSFDPCLACAVH